jgi:hypothetical protein
MASCTLNISLNAYSAQTSAQNNMLPSGSLPVFCDCLLVNEVGLKQYPRVAQLLLLTVMMLPSGSLQVFCDCLLVNEVGLKQYPRVAQVLLPTVLMLPSESLQVFCDCLPVNEVG